MDTFRSLHELLQRQDNTPHFLPLSLPLRLPMFIQRDMTLKCLSTISTINESFSISMRTFMSTKIGELCVRFRTELNQNQ